MRDQILNHLLTVKYATINNFYSQKANTSNGALLQPARDFKVLEKGGYIREIPQDERTPDKRRKVFYHVTAKGAKRIDRREEFKRNKQLKSIPNVKHESMKIDVSMAFLRSYPDAFIDFEYKRSIDGKTPDIVAWINKYTFLVEIERKRTPGRVIQETAKKWEKVDFKRHGFPHQTKVLVVYAPIYYDVFMRPQDSKSQERNAYISLDVLMNIAHHQIKNKDRFMFCHFIDFYRIHKTIWKNPLSVYGTKRKLINQ